MGEFILAEYRRDHSGEEHNVVFRGLMSEA